MIQTERPRPLYLTTDKPMTDKQRNYIAVLEKKHIVPDGSYIIPADATWREASALIDWILNHCPKRPTQAQAPVKVTDDASARLVGSEYTNATVNVPRPGAYIDDSGTMWLVSKRRGKQTLYGRKMWLDGTRRVTGQWVYWSSWVATPGLRRMTLKECADYGHRVNRCWDCDTPLEVKTSQLRGIGPVCFGHYPIAEQDEHDRRVGVLGANEKRHRRTRRSRITV